MVERRGSPTLEGCDQRSRKQLRAVCVQWRLDDMAFKAMVAGVVVHRRIDGDDQRIDPA